ncbi:MAG: HPr kinase/phosphorylase, partial [Hyphomicrobiaceae bacterium]
MTSQSADPVLVHATAVARHGAAVLLMGPSGSGKSDLALRLLAQTASPSLPTGDFELVSDDHVLLHRDHDLVIASAPPSIAGKLEVRGIGI